MRFFQCRFVYLLILGFAYFPAVAEQNSCEERKYAPWAKALGDAITNAYEGALKMSEPDTSRYTDGYTDRRTNIFTCSQQGQVVQCGYLRGKPARCRRLLVGEVRTMGGSSVAVLAFPTILDVPENQRTFATCTRAGEKIGCLEAGDGYTGNNSGCSVRLWDTSRFQNELPPDVVLPDNFL